MRIADVQRYRNFDLVFAILYFFFLLFLLSQFYFAHYCKHYNAVLFLHIYVHACMLWHFFAIISYKHYIKDF